MRRMIKCLSLGRPFSPLLCCLCHAPRGTVKNLAHFPTAPRPALRCGYPSSSVTSR